MKVDEVSEAVSVVRDSLEADGYELAVEPAGDEIVLRIVAGPEACAECLVPPTVMEPMLGKLMEDAGLSSTGWSLVYPNHD